MEMLILTEFKAAFDKFAEGRPQATIVFGSPILDCAKFLGHFWTDSRTKGGMVLAPSALHFFIVVQHKALVNSDASFCQVG
ncbi:hypothetical protein [Streptomyces hygroscopicus]|uniref:hypothetical protein n=1 Tax=Streptomyces hygroscopicus TaxID=1912 RepID=UPI003F1BAA85